MSIFRWRPLSQPAHLRHTRKGCGIANECFAPSSPGCRQLSAPGCCLPCLLPWAFCFPLKEYKQWVEVLSINGNRIRLLVSLYFWQSQSIPVVNLIFWWALPPAIVLVFKLESVQLLPIQFLQFLKSVWNSVVSNEKQRLFHLCVSFPHSTAMKNCI